ncbi:unnamed protein product [Blepharisma stoltei]|uniref:ODAD1 central coiled coil region domain-containing protein n=1 Tax=Blepharisma stoltei TaxID=1481888 RepID=A0AAU9KDQ0_9CILI|nr:unnamed protein product [Blepharisma stoltei]
MESEIYSSLLKSNLLKEKISVRLQKDVENELGSLERERKEAIRLSQLVHETEEELEQVNRKIKKCFENKEILSELSISGKKLETANTLFQEILEENKLLRSQIDSLRQNIIAWKRVIHTTQTETEKYSKLSQQKGENMCNLIISEDQIQQQLSHLRSKSANSHEKFANRINSLAAVIQYEEDHKSQILKNIKESLNVQMFRPLNMLDNAKVANYLISRYKNQIVAKQKETKEYIERIQGLEKALKIITEATGIASCQEITTQFLKSEEQIGGMTRYLNELNTEWDIQLKNLSFIFLFAMQKGMTKSANKKDAMEKSEAIEKKAQKVLEDNKKLGIKCAQVQFQLNHSFSIIKQMLKKCQKAPVKPQINVSPPIVPEETCEENIIFYLSQIEEYISLFQMIISNLSYPRPLTPINLQTSPINVPKLNLILESKELFKDSDSEESKSPKNLDFMKNRAKYLYSAYTERRASIHHSPAKSESIARGKTLRNPE